MMWCVIHSKLSGGDRNEIISSYTLNFPRPRTRLHNGKCFDLCWLENPDYINQTRFANNQSALSQTMRTVYQPITACSQDLGNPAGAGTRLATALRRRPFSECNKGNRRRLHAGKTTIESFYYFEDPVNATTSLLRPGFYGPTVVALTGFHCIYIAV